MFVTGPCCATGTLSDPPVCSHLSAGMIGLHYHAWSQWSAQHAHGRANVTYDAGDPTLVSALAKQVLRPLSYLVGPEKGYLETIDKNKY